MNLQSHICNEVGSKIAVNKKLSWIGLTCSNESDPIQQITVGLSQVKFNHQLNVLNNMKWKILKQRHTRVSQYAYSVFHEIHKSIQQFPQMVWQDRRGTYANW